MLILDGERRAKELDRIEQIQDTNLEALKRNQAVITRILAGVTNLEPQ